MARHPIVSERLTKRLKRLFNRASRRGAAARTRRGSRPTPMTAVKAAKANPSAAKSARTASADPARGSQGKSGKSDAFWSNLFWVRPWLLVVALWLAFVVMIAIALAGLSNPGREMVLEPVNNSIVGQPLSTPDAAAVSRLIPKDEVVLTQRDPAATLPPVTAEAERSMPAWPLLVMVMACAGGCMLMSNQGLLTIESRRGRRRVVTSQAGARPGPRAASSRPVRLMGGSKRQRRAKQRRLEARRPDSQVMAFRPGHKLHSTSPQPQAGAAQSVSFAVNHQTNGEAAPAVSSTSTAPAATAPASSATVTTVVPDSETSPLDWKEGSLAHKLDVRQTRSIRSFL